MMMSRILVLVASSAICFGQVQAPHQQNSLRFAVIGDSGTGKSGQHQVAKMLTESRKTFPFDFVLMAGDNLYGGEQPRDFEIKFERPYKALLDQGVKFYASLGNHDEPSQVKYKHFNMDGKRFYTFKPRDGIRFFALDSTYMSPEQLDWIAKELQNSGSDWKIVFFHHPMYSSGKHGSDLELRKVLEPILIKHGCSVVFAGHEHFYERIKPQQGIHHFVTGAAGKLRDEDIRPGPLTAKGYDQDLSFMLVEIAGDEMHFQSISRTGKQVDVGTVTRRKDDNVDQKPIPTGAASGVGCSAATAAAAVAP